MVASWLSNQCLYSSEVNVGEERGSLMFFKMKKLFYFFVLFIALEFSACKHEEPDAGDLAAIAAKGYYEQLLAGNFQDFVDGTYQSQRIPSSYYKQLVLNAQMFVEQQSKERKGMLRVAVSNVKADTAHHTANVFLAVSYGDSTKEQIVVPMVFVDGKWLMR